MWLGISITRERCESTVGGSGKDVLLYICVNINCTSSLYCSSYQGNSRERKDTRWIDSPKLGAPLLTTPLGRTQNVHGLRFSELFLHFLSPTVFFRPLSVEGCWLTLFPGFDPYLHSSLLKVFFVNRTDHNQQSFHPRGLYCAVESHLASLTS